jgi:hypothetical protein
VVSFGAARYAKYGLHASESTLHYLDVGFGTVGAGYSYYGLLGGGSDSGDGGSSSGVACNSIQSGTYQGSVLLQNAGGSNLLQGGGGFALQGGY